ncbi:MAG: response regulator transcription factor [Bacteroidota bacterium]
MRILLAEDDSNLAYLVQDALRQSGFESTWCEDGKKAWLSFLQQRPDLCILDVMMPEKDGFSLAKRIRGVGSKVPIIFLSARSDGADRLQGLRSGADDYLTKPFLLEELLLRVQAILKRVYGEEKPSLQPFKFGNCELDPTNQLLTVLGHARQLTYRECKLLMLFVQHPGQLLSKDLIRQRVWEDEGIFVGRSLDVFVSRLRRYLKSDPAINLQTVHGLGLKLLVT